MTDKIPIGIVGLNFGRYIVSQLVNEPAFRIAALCDLDTNKASEFAKPLDAKVYGDLDRLLADPDVPTIGLFTGPSGRADLLRKIIRAGKDVMTTKPIETDADAALTVLREAKTLGRVIHLNSPAPVPPPDLDVVARWRKKYDLGRPVACRQDVWASYQEEADGSWYDDPARCPVPPLFRLGIYALNDLVRLLGRAVQVQVMESRLRTGRPTSDNAQMGILFEGGTLATVFASFCIGDGDAYRNSMTLHFERGTIYRNVGPNRPEAPNGARLSLVMSTDNNTGRAIVDEEDVLGMSGSYRWDIFAQAVRGETIPNEATPDEIVEGLRIIEAMAHAESNGGTAEVRRP